MFIYQNNANKLYHEFNQQNKTLKNKKYYIYNNVLKIYLSIYHLPAKYYFHNIEFLTFHI